MLGYRYNMPVVKVKFDRKSFDSSLPTEFSKNKDYILEYNKKMESIGFKSNYKSDGYIWLPVYLSENKNLIMSTVESEKVKSSKPGIGEYISEPLFGKQFKDVKVVSEALKGFTFYEKIQVHIRFYCCWCFYWSINTNVLGARRSFSSLYFPRF